MRGKQIRMALVPVALAAGLSACASNGVSPGYVSGPSSASASSSTYGGGTPTGEAGRVVSVNEVPLRGGGGGMGANSGTMSGGLIGAAGGSAIGAMTSRSVGGILVGAVLGAVGGAIAGTIVQGQGGNTGRGIEVTVQKDDGQTIRVAQRDEGDIQLGDRVAIVQDRSGTAKAVRDNSRSPDFSQQPQNHGPQYNGPPSQYGGPPPQYNGSQDRGVPPAEYGQQQRYSQARYGVRPQDDPRNGNLN